MKQQLKSKLPFIFGLIKNLWYRLRRLNPFISSRYLYLFRGKYFDLKQLKLAELFPNLFIIGSEKSGTTSLHHYLDQHPEIFMSKPDKEPQLMMPPEVIDAYFKRAHINIRNKNDLLKNHMLRKYQGQKYIGESTTSYTRGGNATKYKMGKVFASMQPQPRLIYIVRHPLERIVSNYLHKRRGMGLDKPLAEELRNNVNYLRTSLYGTHFKQYHDEMPDNILLIYFEDFVNKPQEHLKQICRFLNIDESFKFHTKQVFNKATNNPDGKTKIPNDIYEEVVAQLQSDINLLETVSGKRAPWSFKKSDWT